MIDILSHLWIPARSDTPELLDEPQQVEGDLPANLADIRFLNRWFGGAALALRAVDELRIGLNSFSLLDVATGSADIPVAICRRVERSGASVEVVGVDVSKEVLREARKMASAHSMDLVQGDARSLPWPSGSFDIVMCCLAIHHFSEADARQVLREMWRTCRIGMVVTDLARSYSGYVGTWLLTRILAQNRVTRHDGPLSVLRSYTMSEMQVLAAMAGIPNPEVRRKPPFRQTLIARKGNQSGS